MNQLSRPARAAVVLLALAASLGVAAAVPSPAAAPAAASAQARTLRLAPGTAPVTVLRLPEAPAALIDAAKRGNARALEKRLQVGVARGVEGHPEASSDALTWSAVAGGVAAQWNVVSPPARALRVGLAIQRLPAGTEIRFAGKGGADTVYGPFGVAELRAAGPTYWSPVLEGESAIVEVFVPAASASQLAVSIGAVSHLFVSPADPKAALLAKTAPGGSPSGACEVDVICRTPGDPALARAAQAVARMSFVDGANTYMCTGTLLNPADGSLTPYFYSATHCIDTQTVASTLTTHWFLETTGCGNDTINPEYRQLPGGATLLYTDAASDGLLLRLNNTPPPGAAFAGWDASTLSGSVGLTALHHPEGDYKKVSLGSFGGFESFDGTTGPNHIIVNWNSTATGVTEEGSSGSGIFSGVGAPASDYRLRGGLHGGPSSCTATRASLYDDYSRLDQIYPSISRYIGTGGGAASANNYTALWWNPAENGWGLNVNHQGSIVFATLFTYDASGNPLWLFLSNGAKQPGSETFSGDLFVATGGPAYNGNGGSKTTTKVGTMTIAFSDLDHALLTYSYNGTNVTKQIRKQAFGTRSQVCQPTTTDRTQAINYTDLWWGGDAQSGWGINITHQDDILFATFFTYEPDGRNSWYFLSQGTKSPTGAYEGEVFRANGPAFGAPWTGITTQSVGTMSLRFTDGANGFLTYTINGTTLGRAISRQVFASPVPGCA